MAVIFFKENGLSPSEPVAHGHEGPFVNWLLSEFPKGFGGRQGHLSVNGKDVPIDDWDIEISREDEATFTLLPGSTGNPLLDIVIKIGAAIATRAIASALTPSPRPPSFVDAPEASPVYSVGIPSNAFKLGGVIPVQYGAVRRAPEYASQPYLEFDDNGDEVFRAILCLGAGYFDTDNAEVWIGSASQSSLLGTSLTVRYFAPDEHLSTLGNVDALSAVHENVFTSIEINGQPLTNQNQTSQSGIFRGVLSGTADIFITSATPASLGLSAGLSGVFLRHTITGPPPTQLPDEDDFELYDYSETVTILAVNGNTITLDTTGFHSPPPPTAGPEDDDRWFFLIPAASNPRVVGPVIAVPAGETTRRIDVDLSFPGGLYKAETDGSFSNASVSVTIRFQEIDDNGADVGSPIDRVTTITDNSNREKRLTIRNNLEAGRYKVTLTRPVVAQDNSVVDDISVIRVKSFLDYDTSATVYGPVTLVAVTLRASDKIAPEGRGRIQVRAPRQLPLFGGGALGDRRTAADAVFDILTSADYSVATPSADIDLTAFTAFRTDEPAAVNCVFDAETNVQDATRSVAQSVFADLVERGAILTIDHDKPRTAPTRIFTPDNIVRDSLLISYVIGDETDTDGIELVYRDPNTGDPKSIREPSSSVRPARSDLFGSTDPVRTQATAERLWRARRLKHTRVQFETGAEGKIVARGDLVSIAHPQFSAGNAALVRSATAAVITIDHAPVDALTTYTAYVRDAEGDIHGPRVVEVSGNQVTGPGGGGHGFATSIFAHAEQGGVLLSFTRTGEDTIEILVEDIRPTSNKTVRIEGAIYDDRVYT